MMEAKNYQRNQKLLATLIGIFLIFLAIGVILDMGYIMRTLTGAFLFLFGNFYYVVAALMIFEGFFLIIKSHLFLPKHRWQGLLLAIALLLALMLTSAITMKVFYIETFNDVIKDFFKLYNSYSGGFYVKEYINTLEVSFGGGLFGYFLAVPVSLLVGVDLTIVIAAVALGAMLIIVNISNITKCIKFFKAKAKNRKENKPAEGETKPKEKKHKKTKEEKLQEKYKNSFVNESNVYLHANEVGNDEVIPVMKSTELSGLGFENANENVTPTRTVRPLTETGTLELARLDLFGDGVKETAPLEHDMVYVNPSEKQEVMTSIEEFENKEIPVTEEKKEIEVDLEPMEEAPVVETKVEEPVVEAKVEHVEVSREKEIDVLPKKTEPKREPVVEEVKSVEVKPSKVNWVPPSTDKLVTYQTEEQVQQNIDEAIRKQGIVNKVFQDFHVQAECVDFVIGPSITRLLIDYPSTGTIKAVDKLKTDISRLLDGVPVRFAETVQGTRFSGFEVPNPVSATVSFKEVFEALPPVDKHPTAVAFGKDIAGSVVYADICDFPHMLVSGTSGSGKSVFINSLIVTLMARTSPEDLKIVLVDPKRVEMNRYRESPHLFCPVINDANEAKVMLYKMVDYMNERYAQFEEADYATSLKDYNKWAKANNRKTMPYIIIILDEYADLAYTCKEVGIPLVSICQKARACGIHVIVSTQRPSTDVITGTIKANLNTRVSLTAASYVDSMTILDEGGAEGLLGNGDMLVKSPLISRTGLARLQGCYIQGGEIAYIINYLKKNYKPEYEESFLDLSEDVPEPATNALFNSPLGETGDNEEDKYNWIKQWATMQDYVSMSKIQRECNVGFNRAGKMVRRLQDDGILSTEAEGSNRGFKVINGESRFNDAPPVDSGELKN